MSQLALLPALEVEELNKKELVALGEVMAKDLIESGSDVTKAYVIIKKYLELLKSIDDNIKTTVMAELEKNNREMMKSGVQLNMQEAGVKYDYSSSPTWVNFQEKINEIKQMQEAHEKFLKSLKGATAVASEETDGELITYYPPAKSSTTTIKTSIK